MSLKAVCVLKGTPELAAHCTSSRLATLSR
uniref:DNA topoisomerase III n=1 Tax=Macrostomum lignano TaxID=282301 RepID=A0A1I8GFR4_9PLAT